MTNTKTRILDAAEKLFGQRGIDATSLRAITKEAGVNLAAVNYHFQSKDSLVDAVIARRIEPLNRKRLEMLDAAGSHATVEQIMEAFLRPVVESELETTNFRQLFGKIYASPEEFMDRVFSKHLTGVAMRFREALARAIPEAPEAERMWRLLFSIGGMSLVLAWGTVIGRITGGLCDPSDHKALARRLVAFTSAGMRAAATEN